MDEFGEVHEEEDDIQGVFRGLLLKVISGKECPRYGGSIASVDHKV